MAARHLTSRPNTTRHGAWTTLSGGSSPARSASQTIDDEILVQVDAAPDMITNPREHPSIHSRSNVQGALGRQELADSKADQQGPGTQPLSRVLYGLIYGQLRVRANLNPLSGVHSFNLSTRSWCGSCWTAWASNTPRRRGSGSAPRVAPGLRN